MRKLWKKPDVKTQNSVNPKVLRFIKNNFQVSLARLGAGFGSALADIIPLQESSMNARAFTQPVLKMK